MVKDRQALYSRKAMSQFDNIYTNLLVVETVAIFEVLIFEDGSDNQSESY